MKLSSGSLTIEANTKIELLDKIEDGIKKNRDWWFPERNKYEWWVENCFTQDATKTMKALMYQTTNLGIYMHFKWLYEQKYGLATQMSFEDL